MPLVTCSRFLRPCFGRITPALGSFRLSKYRLFHSLEKRSKSAVNRLQASRQASGGSKSSEPASDNALLAIGIGLLGGSLAYVSMRLMVTVCIFWRLIWAKLHNTPQH